MGKPARNASTSGSGSGSASVEIKAAVMEALTDSTVLATLAEHVADAVFAKFEKRRMSAFESELLDKDQRIGPSIYASQSFRVVLNNSKRL